MPNGFVKIDCLMFPFNKNIIALELPQAGQGICTKFFKKQIEYDLSGFKKLNKIHAYPIIQDMSKK